jgi:hypothetical protein
MSSISLSTRTATPPKTPVHSAEPASTGSGFVLQDHPGDKSLLARLYLSPAAKDHVYASVGAIREDHYTEF